MTFIERLCLQDNGEMQNHKSQFLQMDGTIPQDIVYTCLNWIYFSKIALTVISHKHIITKQGL